MSQCINCWKDLYYSMTNFELTDTEVSDQRLRFFSEKFLLTLLERTASVVFAAKCVQHSLK